MSALVRKPVPAPLHESRALPRLPDMRALILSLLLLLALVLPGPAAAQAGARVVPEGREQITLSFAPLVRRAAPAVVNVYSSRIVRERPLSPLFEDPFFQRFFGPGLNRPRQRVQNSLGSGVIVRPDGLVVTNHHVIEGAEQIRVVLNDGREFEASLLLSDERTDLALLQIESGSGQLPYLELAESDTDLQVGDLVIAIGNPFGVGQTVTSGIVSALARNARGISDYSFFIQTDAAINPGNSGGALIAMDGSLVGINTAIYSRTGGSLGIGFAIPASMVRAVIASLDNGGRIVRPWLGISGQNLTSDLAESLGVEIPRGVLVNRVDRGSPADRAGLKVGDIVVALDGAPVDTTDGLRFRMATVPIGSSAALTVLRNGRELTLTVSAEPPPEIPPRNETLIEGPYPLAGAVVANLSPALIEETGYDGVRRSGPVVLEVRGRSPAARLGVEPGDVVVSINGTEVSDVDQLTSLMSRSRSRGFWRIGIQRGDRLLEAVVNG